MVELPINRSAVMNAKLAEWINESVKRMNESKNRKGSKLLGDHWAS